MWIRSQNQENYLDASGKTFSIYNGNQIRMKYANSSVLLGEYSSSKKAHNVLNKLRKQNDKWHSMNVLYSGNNMSLTISSSSMNNVLAALEETNTFEMQQDEDV